MNTKTVTGNDFISIHLPRTGFDVYGDVLAFVIRLNLGFNIAVIDFITKSGSLFFSMPRLTYCHGHVSLKQ